MDKTCIYHEDKLGFDDVRKDLQKGKWIPRQYAQRLAMAVCACRRNIDCKPANNLDLEKYKSCIHARLNRSEDTENGVTLSPSLRSYITDCLTTTNNTQYSKCRLLHILYSAIHKQYDLLNRAAISNNEPIETVERVRKKPARVTPAIKMMIERRKKKKMEMKLVKLPMSAGNTKKLEVLLQKSIFDFSQKKGCLVEYDKARNDESFRRKKDACYLKVFSANPVAFKDVRDKLVEKAAQVQRLANEAYERRRIERAIHKRLQWDVNVQRCDAFEDGVMYNPSKEVREKDFEKKTLNASRGRGGKVHTPVLKGGRCLQCLKSYTSLKDSSQCHYHPGYLVNQGDESMWTCCGQPTDEDVATFDDHKSTGCTEANRHMWRLHQNANRKSLNWMRVGPGIPRKYAKKRATKHLYKKVGIYDEL